MAQDIGMVKARNFRDLEVWKLGKEVVLDVYRVTAEFPREELYGLASQMRRAAVSIPSNVAEGFNRKHNREYRQSLYIVLGSCAELERKLAHGTIPQLGCLSVFHRTNAFLKAACGIVSPA